MILSNTRGAFLRSRTPWANVIAGVDPDAADERGRGASQEFTALTGCDEMMPRILNDKQPYRDFPRAQIQLDCRSGGRRPRRDRGCWFDYRQQSNA
jgi:hypothetical protein